MSNSHSLISLDILCIICFSVWTLNLSLYPLLYKKNNWSQTIYTYCKHNMDFIYNKLYMEEVGQYDCGQVSEGAWIVLSIGRSISLREKVRQSNIL